MRNKKFFEIILKNKNLFFLAILMTIIYSGTSTFASYSIAFLARIITTSTKDNYLNVIFTNLPIVIGAWVLYLIVGYFTGLVRNKLKMHFKTNLRKYILKKMFSLDYKEYKEVDNGKFLSWLSSDIEKIKSNSFISFFDMINSLFILIFSLGSMFFVNITLAISCFVIALLTLVFPKIFDKLTQKSSEVLTYKNENFIENIKNLILGYEVLELSNNQEIFERKIEEYSKEIEYYDYKYNMVFVLVQSMRVLIVILPIIIMSTVSAYIVFKYSLGIPVYIGVNSLSVDVFNNISEFFVTKSDFNTSIPILKKYDYYEKVKKEKLNLKFDSIKLENVSFKYNENDAKYILHNKNISFDFPKKYYILGESGSGKSTLVKIL